MPKKRGSHSQVAFSSKKSMKKLAKHYFVVVCNTFFVVVYITSFVAHFFRKFMVDFI